jgi:hypothetical protein
MLRPDGSPAKVCVQSHNPLREKPLRLVRGEEFERAKFHPKKKRQRRALVEARDAGRRVGTSTLLGDPCSCRCLTRSCLAGNWGLPGWLFHGRPIPRRILSSFSPPARRHSKDAHGSEGQQSLHCRPSEQFYNVHLPFQTSLASARFYLTPPQSLTCTHFLKKPSPIPELGLFTLARVFSPVARAPATHGFLASPIFLAVVGKGGSAVTSLQRFGRACRAGTSALSPKAL